MDTTDRKLLTLLQQDATLSIAQLAEQVGLSADPVLETHPAAGGGRRDRAPVAIVNPELVGLGLTVFVAIEAGGPFARLAGAIRRCRRRHAGGDGGAPHGGATSTTCCASSPPTSPPTTVLQAG
ncbi:MAG: Lrp/AsnC family transcriptional regulator [Acetobacteraceae bacterium]